MIEPLLRYAWGMCLVAIGAIAGGCSGESPGPAANSGAANGATGSGGGGAATSSTGSGGGDCVPVDDHDPCTDDVCEGGIPVSKLGASSAPCNDGNACTQTDTCVGGVCMGGNLVICEGRTHCSSGVCIAPCAGGPGFTTGPTPGVLHAPISVAAAELNGDGRPDLVVVSSPVNKVSVLEKLGNGTFAAPVDYATGDHPSAVAAADLDSDGAIDLVVASYFGASVGVLLNQGNGTFSPRVDLAVGTQPLSIAAADLDGDGKPDLAVSNALSGDVSVLLNQGNGTFAAMVNYASSSAAAIIAADLDGDGKLDLAVTSTGCNTVRVLVNQGNGTFKAALDRRPARFLGRSRPST